MTRPGFLVAIGHHRMSTRSSAMDRVRSLLVGHRSAGNLDTGDVPDLPSSRTDSHVTILHDKAPDCETPSAIWIINSIPRNSFSACLLS